MNTFLLWLKSLAAAFIGGGATAASAWGGFALAQSAGVDVPQLNWQALLIIFLTAGVSNALAYLKRSPLPGITLAICALLLLPGCARLDGYDRSYSVSYRDADGRELQTGVTLHPRGYAK